MSALRVCIMENLLSHVMSHVTCRLQTTCFNNRDVETSVAAALKSNGVEVYSGFLLARYNENEEQSDEVRYMAFTSNTRPLRLECRAFISFYRKMVDLDAFQGKFLCGRFPRNLVVTPRFLVRPHSEWSLDVSQSGVNRN